MNILKMRRFEVLKEIRKVNQPVDKEKYVFSKLWILIMNCHILFTIKII